MNQKVRCFKCDSKIAIPSNIQPLSKVNCPNCETEITIPYVIGDMVMEKQLSVNSLYSTYRAYRQGDSENLLVRVIEKATRTYEECVDIAREISHLNSNAGNDLQVIHSDSKIILVRPYFSQSIKNYLEEKRPTAESAYKTLVNMTEQLRKAAGSGLFYESFSLENVFVNSQGEIVLSDLEIDRVIKHPAAPTSTKITLGMKSYLKTVYELTCASTYVDGIQEATLSLRDETPQDLHDFVNELIQADSCFKGFADALQFLNKADLQKTMNASQKRPDSQDLLTKKKSSSGSLLKKKAAQGKLKSKNVLKKNRRKTPVGMPLVLTAILLLGAAYFVIQDGTIFKQPPKPVVVKKAPEPQKKKAVAPKKTVVKEVIAHKEIKPLPKIEEVIDMKGHIELQTFLEIMEAKCTSCHGAEGKEVEGKFNLVKLMSSNGIHPKHWQAVYSQIAKNEMPPEDETQLTEDEKIIVLNQLKEMISQTEVTRKSRALTPDEIKNTLVDIFKIDQDTYNPFTPLYANYAQDDFYTTQKSVITPYYLDDLYETLHDALESYVALKPQIDPLNLQATFPKRVPLGWKVGDQTELRWNGTGTYFVQTQFKNLSPEPKKQLKNRDLVGPDSKINEQLARLTLPPGTYKLSFDAQVVNLGRAVNEKKFGPEVAKIFNQLSEKHEYSLPLDFFIVPPGQNDPHARTKKVTTIDISSSEMSRYTVEFTLNRRNGIGYRFPVNLMPGAGRLASLIAKHQVKGRPVELKDHERAMQQFIYNDKYDFTKINFKNVQIEGPFDVVVSPYSLADAERFNNINIRKKFRALHNENLIQMNMSYDYIFDKFRQRQIQREESYRNSLVAFFLSTEFLTLEYDRKDRRKHGRMLSYVFHKSTPSPELNQEIQKAIKTKDISSFTDWLVEHPHFERYIESFSKQWLHLSNVLEAVPEKRKFRRFHDEKYMDSYTEEAKHFILHLFKENRPIKEIVAADYSVLDNKLISFYGGGPKHENDGFYKHTFNNNDRGGILSTGAFLTATGNGVEQLPIKRAEWILKNLLDSHLPPPPDDIELDDFQKDLSAPLHERLKAHSQDAKCYSCHKKIDPLAIMMNGFNTIGEFDYGNSYTKVKLNGEVIRDFKEFKTYLGTQEETLARSFIKALLRYSLGRDLFVQDNPLLEKIIDENRANNFPVKDLMKSIMKYYFF